MTILGGQKSKNFDFFLLVTNGFLYGLGVVWGLFKWILDIFGGPGASIEAVGAPGASIEAVDAPGASIEAVARHQNPMQAIFTARRP